jgi:hypothetical protein
VYIYEPIPLKEGEEKHVISVFVADESGLINRVAGVFARRGALYQRAAMSGSSSVGQKADRLTVPSSRYISSAEQHLAPLLIRCFPCLQVPTLSPWLWVSM